MAQHGNAVGSRHGEVGEHEVQVELFHQRHGNFSVRRGMHFVALADQQLDEALARRFLIFDD